MHDGPVGPSLVLYEAIADYEGESDKDQTTLHVGSRVKVLDKKEHGEEGCEGGEGEERRKGGREGVMEGAVADQHYELGGVGSEGCQHFLC